MDIEIIFFMRYSTKNRFPFLLKENKPSDIGSDERKTSDGDRDEGSDGRIEISYSQIKVSVLMDKQHIVSVVSMESGSQMLNLMKG